MLKAPFTDPHPVALGVRQLAVEMAHEVWNPLTVIKTMVFAMLADLPAQDGRSADFNVINMEIARMERSIQQFMDYTWPPDPVFAPVRLGQTVTRAIARFSDLARQQGIHIESSLDDDVRILADPMQIEQVFVNLGMNALRTMPTGGELLVEVRRERVVVNLALNAVPVALGSPGPQPSAVAEKAGVGLVSDSGDGIDMELIDQIFDPFIVKGTEGAGLALAIVEQIVARNGGQVIAHNRPAGGATFTVTFPLLVDAIDESM